MKYTFSNFSWMGIFLLFFSFNISENMKNE
nr:MAG TPA: hypothetical protein [Bacteriophage sp.]